MIFEKVCAILAEALNADPDEITMETLIMEDLEKVRTVGDVVKYLEEVVE